MRGRPPLSRRDVRRQWECPVCGKRLKTPGHIVNQSCTCKSGDAPAWMRLCEKMVGGLWPVAGEEGSGSM